MPIKVNIRGSPATLMKAYGPDYHKWMVKFKEEFDPDALSNPPGPADTDLFIQEAE